MQIKTQERPNGSQPKGEGAGVRTDLCPPVTLGQDSRGTLGGTQGVPRLMTLTSFASCQSSQAKPRRRYSGDLRVVSQGTLTPSNLKRPQCPNVHHPSQNPSTRGPRRLLVGQLRGSARCSLVELLPAQPHLSCPQQGNGSRQGHGGTGEHGGTGQAAYSRMRAQD